MGGNTVNYFRTNKLEAGQIINLGSTATTSVTFVVNITGLTTSSTKITFTKQTAYLEFGSVLGLSTVTTTNVIAT